MPKLTLLSLFLLISINAVTQNITFANLKGIWRSLDSTNKTHYVFFNFTSRTQVIEVDVVKGDNPFREVTTFTYQLDNSTSPTLIKLTEKSDRPNKLIYYFLLKIENGILKIQGDLGGKKIIRRKWETPTLDNTGFFERAKNFNLNYRK